jgi:hypothetical protein
MNYAVSQTPLLKLHSEAKGRVQIMLDGVPADEVFLVQLSVANTGYEQFEQRTSIVRYDLFSEVQPRF